MQAKETIYNGYRFRSRLEARWAVFFDTLSIRYEYEYEDQILPNGTRYLPDFYLPAFNCWIEIKGLGQTQEEAVRDTRKAEQLSWCTKKVVFMFFNCWPGEIKDVSILSDHGPDFTIENFGYYWTPDGDSDGMMAFGFCPVCNTVTIGHIGGHWIHCNNKAYEIYKGTCKGHPNEIHPYLLTAYTAARQARFEHGEKPIIPKLVLPSPKPSLPEIAIPKPLPQKPPLQKESKPLPVQDDKRATDIKGTVAQNSLVREVIKTFSAKIVAIRDNQPPHYIPHVSPPPVPQERKPMKDKAKEWKPMKGGTVARATAEEIKDCFEALDEDEWKTVLEEFYPEETQECVNICGRVSVVDHKCFLCGSPMCAQCSYFKDICQECIEESPCTDCKEEIAREHSCYLCDAPLCAKCYSLSHKCNACYTKQQSMLQRT